MRPSSLTASAILAGLVLGACSTTRAEISLEPVTEAEGPVFLTHAGDDSGRLFVVEQRGLIQILKNGRKVRRPFLDIAARVRAGGERGLLGLAFHPEFAENGRFFVNYTRRPDGATVVSEFRVSSDADLADNRERVLLTIEQPYGNHNGGMIAFGPDGHLYVAMGDGGSGGDPQNHGQDTGTLLGAILRIDVDQGDPYGIPPDNPFAEGGGEPEIFAYGLRNPWRFSFDRESGALWAGDVGQNRIEEIDVVEQGGNYGWRIMEGTACFEPGRGCDETGLELPVAEYRQSGGRCSVTGGYVYRGEAMPELDGHYVFGDYCSGEILAHHDGETRVLLETGLAISSFGEDAAGELYVLDLGGTIARIAPGLASADN